MDTVTARSTERDLDSFLASVERRALVMAEIGTRNREEALDLVQDAMLAFVDKYARHPAEQWPPLFHRVLQNRITDWHRRSRVRNRWRVWLSAGDDGSASADPIQTTADPRGRSAEDDAAIGDAGDALITAIASLPLRQQQAFLLRTWEGLDVAATARVMGCSGGSVKTHLSRAMQTLRSKLEEHWL